MEVYLIFKNHLPSGALINSVTQKKNKKILLSCGEPLVRNARKRLNEAEIPKEAKKIEIIELDELFTYCQKKLTASTYGLLLIESEVKLLTLK